MRQHYKVAVLTLIAGLLVTTTLITSAYAAVSYGPARPGDLLFGLQDTAEQTHARLFAGPEAQAGRYVRLAERRFGDVTESARTPRELLTLAHAHSALDRALLAVARATRNAPRSGAPGWPP